MAEEAKPVDSAAPAAPAPAEEKVSTPESKAPEAAAEPKVEEKKAEEPKKEQPPVVPEKYDLKIPEGSVVDARFVEKIAAVAKAQGLSNEQAQALLNQQSQEIGSYVKEQSDTWKSQALADKEIGGDNLNKNVALASRVISKFGSDSLRAELDKTGYGNHPEVIRLLSKIGAAIGEDHLVMPGSTSSAPKSRVEKYYGNGKGS